jgi:methionyl-tRNA formyltransferase
MRLAILTSDGLEHRYVASVLCRAFPDMVTAIVLARPQPESLQAQIAKYWRRYSASQLCSRVAAKLYARLTRQNERRHVTLSRILSGPGDPLQMPRMDLVRIVPSHNGPECEAILSGIRPDVIAVYGTGVIKPRIIRLASVSVLNMHTGISPRYRGADTVFWPLYNREPEWIGITVHVLDEGIDSGPVIFTGRPSIDPNDDEDSLFAKCVTSGADLYAEAIRQIATGTVRFTPQQLESGRQYRFVDRTVAAERRVKRLLKSGLLARIAQTPR